MKTFINPTREQWFELATRPKISQQTEVEQSVAEIIRDVKLNGDEALFRLTRKIDGVDIENLKISEQEIADAVKAIPTDLKQAIDTAIRNIRTFHSAQLTQQIDIETTPGVRCLQRQVAIQSVGLYIPGGSAPLFSTVLMLGIPAKLAGCTQITICTPPAKDGSVSPAILYAASACGISQIFRIGGAQAIAAMAYGTQTIPCADKIFGPGNRYVTTAKKQVSHDVAIDMPAGPSEVLLMADDSAVPAFAAADLLSQAEHGSDSQVILLASSIEVANKIYDEVGRQLKSLSRSQIASQSLEYSRIIILENRDEITQFSNLYGPEHLIICTEHPWDIADKITSAGSIFIGNYTPESAGDYASGTNHTLPTSGWSRSMSGVNMDSFMRKITIQHITPEGLSTLGATIETMAAAEGLDAHKNAVTIRLNALREQIKI